MSNEIQLLQTNAASTVSNIDWPPGVSKKTFQASMDNTVSAAAVVEIIASNDGANYHVIGTMTLSGANDVQAYVNNDAWQFISARTTATPLVGTVTVFGYSMGR